MLYNVTLIIITILVPLLCFYAFMTGYNLGAKEQNKDKLTLPRIIPNKKDKTEVPKDVKRLSTLLDNINNYDGTGNNQKVVR